MIFWKDLNISLVQYNFNIWEINDPKGQFWSLNLFQSMCDIYELMYCPTNLFVRTIIYTKSTISNLLYVKCVVFFIQSYRRNTIHIQNFLKIKLTLKEYYNVKVNKISIILMPIFKFDHNLKKIAHSLIYGMRCRKKFSGQNGDSIAGRKLFRNHSNFTLWQSMIHRWKAKSLSYMAVPIAPIRPFTKCGSFWSHQSYMWSWVWAWKCWKASMVSSI